MTLRKSTVQTCRYCGTEFWGTPKRKTCGDPRCQNRRCVELAASKKERVHKNCVICGKDMYDYEWRKTCSEDCALILHRNNRQPNNIPESLKRANMNFKLQQASFNYSSISGIALDNIAKIKKVNVCYLSVLDKSARQYFGIYEWRQFRTRLEAVKVCNFICRYLGCMMKDSNQSIVARFYGIDHASIIHSIHTINNAIEMNHSGRYNDPFIYYHVCNIINKFILEDMADDLR